MSLCNTNLISARNINVIRQCLKRITLSFFFHNYQFRCQNLYIWTEEAVLYYHIYYYSFRSISDLDLSLHLVGTAIVENGCWIMTYIPSLNSHCSLDFWSGKKFIEHKVDNLKLPQLNTYQISKKIGSNMWDKRTKIKLG